MIILLHLAFEVFLVHSFNKSAGGVFDSLAIPSSVKFFP